MVCYALGPRVSRTGRSGAVLLCAAQGGAPVRASAPPTDEVDGRLAEDRGRGDFGSCEILGRVLRKCVVGKDMLLTCES
jgi:hypothetical protein